MHFNEIEKNKQLFNISQIKQISRHMIYYNVPSRRLKTMQEQQFNFIFDLLLIRNKVLTLQSKM